jgi:ATP-dependent protease ClpP protease subunit
MPDQYRFWGKAKPQRHEEFFNLAAPRASADETTATIRMYGPIDSWGGIWGVSAEEVSAALDTLPDTVTHIQLRINSPGGDGFEGLAILNMLRAHPATVTAVVDGLAASAASFIASGCDETVMSPGTQMMIHDAWGFAMGNAGDMVKAATFLDSISDSIADLYAEATNGTRAKWRALMKDETWFTAKESVAAGLADRVGVVPDLGVATTAGAEEPDEDDLEPVTDPEMQSKFDLTVFKYAGRDEAPAPSLSADDPAPEPTPEPEPDPAPETSASEESADPTAEEAATPDDSGVAAESAEESADEPDLTAQALMSLQENVARFAFGG